MTIDVAGPKVIYTGLSTDTKPSADVDVGSEFVETDTGNTYRYHGSSGWMATNTVWPGYVAVQSDYRGNYPGNNYIPINTVRTATDVLTITALHGIRSGQFKISGLDTERLTIDSLADGGGSAGPILLKHVDNVIPGTVVNSIELVDGTYEIEGELNCATLVATKNAAVNTVTLSGHLGG